MRLVARIAWLPLLIWPVGSGCNRNPFVSQQASPWQQQPQPQQQAQLAQLQDLDRRASQLDANNRDLHSQLAQSQQQARLLQDQVTLLQKRLSETAGQLRDMQVAKQEVEKRVEGLQASTRFRGGAAISANNSVRTSLAVVQIPGFEVRQDGDVIRIAIPADQLFPPGAAQLHAGAYQLIDRVAAAIASSYPRQIVGIEGYTDAAPVGGGFTSNHQLAAAQTLAVFDHLRRLNRLSDRQLFVMAQGANRPRASNATPAGRAENRRVELVIYPETAEDR
jgi:chemotaxis protein MotB